MQKIESFNKMSDSEIEIHPFPPFIFPDTETLIMGTFPPQPKRWSMEFYYPNRTNDFWYMMGLIFYGDRFALMQQDGKHFDLSKIKDLLISKQIGLSDTGYKIRRLKDNASDKFLEIIEPVPLKTLIESHPAIKRLCSTGEKAAKVLAELTHTEPPKMGHKVSTPDGLEIWRMPSTSRAYPMRLEDKATYYRKMFDC